MLCSFCDGFFLFIYVMFLCGVFVCVFLCVLLSWCCVRVCMCCSVLFGSVRLCNVLFASRCGCVFLCVAMFRLVCVFVFVPLFVSLLFISFCLLLFAFVFLVLRMM